MKKYEWGIVGGGIAGIAIGEILSREGHTAVLIEKNKQLASETKHGLIIGEEVNINGSGKIEGGKIIKINRTRAVIDCFDKNRGFNVEYTVPFSMIRRINNGWC